MVQEFYVNASDKGDDTVGARGKVIPFDRRSINEYYSLPTMDGDEYSDYISNELDLHKVVDTICCAGAVWKMSSDKPVSVKANTLCQYAKIWHYFIGSQLILSLHLSDVMKDRAILIFCILIGCSIYIGSIMHASFCHSIRGATVRPHFPSFIISMCQQRGVVWGLMRKSVNRCMLLTIV